MNRLATPLLTVMLMPALAWAHGGEDHSHDAPPPPAPRVAGSTQAETVAARRLPDGSLFVPKAVQRQIGLRHRLAHIETMSATHEFNGRVIADPGASGRVQAAQDGRIEATPAGLPLLGQKVSQGQVLAWLVPTANSIERGNQRALAAELAAQLALAESRLARVEQLEGAIPKKEIEAARIEVAALKQRGHAINASLNSREPLTAPTTGVIAATHAVAGQVAARGDLLFEVIDPSRLAVEALAYDPALAAAITHKAEAIRPDGSSLSLQFIGQGRVLREQAMPILFRIVAPHPQPPSPKGRGESWQAPVAVGQPLKIIARSQRTHTGALLPRSALIKTGAGEAAVWVRDGAERFVLRRVGIESHDADTVAAITGLQAGERVVTDGASLLSQVR